MRNTKLSFHSPAPAFGTIILIIEKVKFEFMFLLCCCSSLWKWTMKFSLFVICWIIFKNQSILKFKKKYVLNQLWKHQSFPIVCSESHSLDDRTRDYYVPLTVPQFQLAFFCLKSMPHWILLFAEYGGFFFFLIFYNIITHTHTAQCASLYKNIRLSLYLIQFSLKIPQLDDVSWSLDGGNLKL